MSPEKSRYKTKDEKGKEYIIVEYQKVESTGELANPLDITLGGTYFRTLGGDIVNQIDSETFQIIDGNIIVRKV